MQKSIEIFFCYAREDETLRQELEKQLRALRRQGIIDLWHDRNISAGTEWEFEIDQHLNTAKIILLLVSPDFMDSDYCYSIEMKKAMERHELGDARVIPIILRHVYWQKAPFGKLQALPLDAIPIVSSKWHSQDEAFFNVAEGIRLAVEKLTAKDVAKQWMTKGDTLRNQERYQEALTNYDRAISLNANDATTFASRGETYRRMERYQEALTDFDRAISLDTNDAWAFAHRGETCRLMKRYQEALTDFDRAISLDTNDAWAFASRGAAYRQMKHYQEALADHDRAISLDTNYAWAIAGRGETYRLMERYQEALTDYDRAISLNVNLPWVPDQRNRVYSLLNH